MTQAINRDFDNDILLLKDRFSNPAPMFLAPFAPLLVASSLPLTFAVLTLPVIDFFSTPRKLCRKYIGGFQQAYVAVLLATTLIRLAFEFTNGLVVALGSVQVIVFLGWTYFAWSNWRKLYDAAQHYGDDGDDDDSRDRQ